MVESTVMTRMFTKSVKVGIRQMEALASSGGWLMLSIMVEVLTTQHITYASEVNASKIHSVVHRTDRNNTGRPLGTESEHEHGSALSKVG